MFSIIGNSIRIKQRQPSTMSLYGRGSMRSSSQNSNIWNPSPIFYLPPSDAADPHTLPDSITDQDAVLPPGILHDSSQSEEHQDLSEEEWDVAPDRGPQVHVSETPKWRRLTGNSKVGLPSDIVLAEPWVTDIYCQTRHVNRLELTPGQLKARQNEDGLLKLVMEMAPKEAKSLLERLEDHTYEDEGDTIDVELTRQEAEHLMEQLNEMFPGETPQFELREERQPGDVALTRQSAKCLLERYRDRGQGKTSQVDIHRKDSPSRNLADSRLREASHRYGFDSEDNLSYWDLAAQEPVEVVKTAVYSLKGGVIERAEEVEVRGPSGEYQRSRINSETICTQDKPEGSSPPRSALVEEDTVRAERVSAEIKSSNTGSEDDESIYLNEVDSEDGGAPIGEVKTFYQEMEEKHDSLKYHPIINKWSLSEFIDEWTRPDGLIQHMLAGEKLILCDAIYR